ncbi:MAG: hypothetical protein AB1801_10345 [Chloroflexota bacterium]
MLKSVYVGGLGLGLALLLAACGATAVDSPPAPVEEQAPAAAEVTQPDIEDAPPAEEKTVVEEKMVSTDEPVEEVSEEMAVAGEPARAEEMVEAEAVKEEPAPLEAAPRPAEMTAKPAEQETITGEAAAAPLGPTPEQQQLLASLTVKGSPPELFNEVWLNSEPLKLADLRGQVVIVEFWTFG